MEKISGPYRAEYENALKDAAATAFLGKVFLIGMNGYWILHFVFTGSAETVGTWPIKDGCTSYRIDRQPRH